ncbi:MAG: hypothetical protein HYV07_20925 [Deltaproteobacteria bacterium]|nr:hypothetical protein [Deltaproteobacteria bacterium]
MELPAAAEGPELSGVAHAAPLKPPHGGPVRLLGDAGEGLWIMASGALHATVSDGSVRSLERIPGSRRRRRRGCVDSTAGRSGLGRFRKIAPRPVPTAEMPGPTDPSRAE